MYVYTALPLPFLHVGSLQWLAPEEMEKKEGERGSGEKADVWSLGCVLLQLATCSFMDVRAASL